MTLSIFVILGCDRYHPQNFFETQLTQTKQSAQPKLELLIQPIQQDDTFWESVFTENDIQDYRVEKDSEGNISLLDLILTDDATKRIRQKYRKNPKTDSIILDKLWEKPFVLKLNNEILFQDEILLPIDARWGILRFSDLLNPLVVQLRPRHNFLNGTFLYNKDDVAKFEKLLEFLEKSKGAI